MDKERVKINLTSSESGIQLITFTAENPEDKVLRLSMNYYKFCYPRPLILVKTPKITPQQVENLFRDGANAWAKLASPEEGPPEPPVK